MFKKAFALASLTALTAVVASSMAAGCSSSTTTTNNAADGSTTTPSDDGGTSNGKDGGKKPTGDASTAGDSCYDESGAQGLKDGVGIGPGGECTQEQLDAFFAACIDAGGTQEACDAAIKGANEGCAKCIFGGNGHIPPLFTIGSSAMGLNYNACIALEIGHPECALVATNQSMCPATACGSCDLSDKTGVDACEKEAQEGICAPFFEDSAAPAGCAEAFKAVDDKNPALAKCIGDGKDFAAAAKLTTKILCVDTHADIDGGTGGTDAGSDAGPQ